jgi:tetratricopeptide (TPR) repeat protein
MNRATFLVCGLILIAFMVMTNQRNETWRDPLTLWQDAAAQSPLKVRPLVNLGVEYQKRGDRERAIQYFSEASAAPHGLEHNRNMARANMAWMYFETGQMQVAIEILNRILQDTPDLRVMNMLALIAFVDGNPSEALRLTDDILKIDSNWRIDPQLRLTRGQAFQQQGKCALANLEYLQVQQLRPDVKTPWCLEGF